MDLFSNFVDIELTFKSFKVSLKDFKTIGGKI